MPVDFTLTILVLLVGFYMAWNIGANDVSNAMGTSVGSGALTLFKAIVIAGVLEFCGAFFLGGHVSKTMEQGIIDPAFFGQDPKILLYGMVSALIATALWLQIASYFGWPVSTTHAIVGALLGFGVLIGGVHTVHWSQVGRIALSWVISPALSALFSYFIFSILQHKVLFAMNPIRATKQLIPLLVFIVLFIFTISVLFNGLGSFHLKLSLFNNLSIGIIIGMIGSGISIIALKKMHFPQSQILSPNVEQQIQSLNKAMRHLKRVTLAGKEECRTVMGSIVREIEEHTKKLQAQSTLYMESFDYKVVEKMFAFLQILSAAYIAFAHGANDVANAIGPIAAALNIIRNGTIPIDFTTPSWLLAMGGAGIVIGLATWGWRLIETIGRKITELTPTRGFSAEFGAAITILTASGLGLPISTTHCVVGSVLGIGLAKGISALNLRMLRDIALSWIITIPSSAIACILIFYVVHAIFS